MKKMISILVISFLGVIFSSSIVLQKQVTDFNQVGLSDSSVCYRVTYYLNLEDDNDQVYFEETLQRLMSWFPNSIAELGYGLKYYKSSWKYRNPYWSFIVDFQHEDPEYAELTIRGCIQDLGKHLKQYAHPKGRVGMFARISSGGKVEIE